MTASPAQLLRGLAVVVVVALWAVAAHLGSANGETSDFSTLLGVAPIIATIGLLLWRSRHPALVGCGGLAVIGGLLWLWPTLRQNVALLYFIQHIGTNLALGTLFGRSLLGPGEALITQLARAVHGDAISERKRRYTRQATVAWTLFFMANSLVSALLFLLAPPWVWSIFANLLSMPLIAAMFLAEHLWRARVLPPDERPTVGQVVRAYRLARQGDQTGQPS